MSITVANTVGMFNLPKEIENLIGEYNVDHRPQMREVFHEMKRKQMFKEMKMAKEATQPASGAEETSQPRGEIV